jgi:prophage antirepressor-like protein
MTNEQTLTKVFEGHNIRIVRKNGEPWLVGRDVTEALNVDRSQLRRLDDDEKGVCQIHTPGGPQKATVINEAGVYRLVFTSQKDAADRFKRWLAHEVLPEIRRTGSYQGGHAGDGASSDDLTTLDAVQGMVQALREQKERLDDMEARQEKTADRLDDVEKSLEEHRAAPNAPTTQFGHEVQGHTWDGMRQAVNDRVREYQRQHGGGYRKIYRGLYRRCESEFGFNPLRVKRHGGGPSGIKALDFDQMRALLKVTRWHFWRML